MQILPKNTFRAPTQVRNAGQAFIPNPVADGEKILVGAVIEAIDGSLELCTTTYPSTSSTIDIILKRSIMKHNCQVDAIIELEDRQAHFPIGEAYFDGKKARVKLFGIPRFEARIVLSRGLRSLPAANSRPD